MIVHQSILLNSLINANGNDHFQMIELETDPNEHSGFLMTIANGLDVHRESCSAWESLLTLYTNQQNISLACTNYMVHYFTSPLKISLLSSVISDLSNYITIVVTSVRLGCPTYHQSYRQCPNMPRFCISRALFCDRFDNCGLNSDELDCTNRIDQIAVTIIDERSDWSLAILSLIGILAILLFVAFFVIWNCRIAQKRRKFMRNKKRHSSYYNTSLRSRDVSVRESEETVALLALGLRNMFPAMPMETAKVQRKQRNSYMAIE